MIPIYICDDEPAVCNNIQDIISKHILIMNYDIGPVRIFENPEKLLDKHCQDTVPAIYFLDIDFPNNINGLDLALAIRKNDPRGFIIFITAHDDLAFETFRYRLEAMDYIVKGDEKIMSERICSCIASIHQRIQDEPHEDSAYFKLKLLDTIRYIPINKIIYCESIGYKHLIRLHMEDEIIDFNSSLGKLENELGERFWRCHRSFLVNRQHISKIHRNQNLIELINGENCLLSRKAKSQY